MRNKFALLIVCIINFIVTISINFIINEILLIRFFGLGGFEGLGYAFIEIITVPILIAFISYKTFRSLGHKSYFSPTQQKTPIEPESPIMKIFRFTLFLFVSIITEIFYFLYIRQIYLHWQLQN